MELTASDVLRAMENAVEDLYWEEIEWAFRDKTTLLVNGINYPFRVMTVESASEGDWDRNTQVVVHVGGQYFRKTGHYMSHYGNDWDGEFEEVVPVTKPVTIWEAK